MVFLLILIIPLQLFAAPDVSQATTSGEQFDVSASLQDQFTELSIEAELPVVWGELIHNLGTEQDYLDLGSISDDVDENGLGLSSQHMDKFLMDTLYTDALSQTSQTLSETEITLSREVLQRLREAGIPEHILQQLQLLGGQGFSQQAIFWEAVENQIGREQTQKYRQIILQHAAGSRTSNELTNQRRRGDSWHLTEQSLENLEGWKDIAYYPRLTKQALAYKSQQAARKRTADLLEEEDSLFDILGLFKRWGIPKPAAVIIIALALYILLALLARQ